MAKFYVTFGSIRPQCLPPTIATAATGNLLAGNLYLALVGTNRYGLNRLSPIVPATWNNGDRLVITIPNTIRTDGEDLHRVILAGSLTNDAATMLPLAWWRGYDWQETAIGSGYYNEVRRTISPAPVIELTHPDHLQVGGVANSPANLLTINSPRDGMLRWVVNDAAGGALGKYFYYDPSSNAIPDGVQVLDAGAAQGNWLPWMISFGVGTISDITGTGGCWRDVRSLNEADIWFPPPAYKMDGGLSSGVIYWLVNNYDETTDPIELGSQIGLKVTQNGALRSSLFNKKLRSSLLGFVRLATGELDTADLTIAETTYTYGEPIYTVEKDLLAGRAIALKIAAAFREEELGGGVGAGALSTTPEILNQVGTLFPGWRLYGNLIYAISDRRRVFPRRGAQVYVGRGAGVVERFEFELQPLRLLPIIPLGGSTLNLKITVNGNGDVFYRDTADLEPTEALRAVIAMETGQSTQSAWSSYVAVSAGGSLAIECRYPQTIDPNYPDVIAGSALGQLNAPSLVLYVQRQSTGEIRAYPNRLIVPGVSQTFAIEDFAGTVTSSVPAGGTGLFLPGAVLPTANLAGGTFPAGSFRLCYAFAYDGGTVTRISHATADGCLPELGGTVSELFALLDTIGLTVSTLAVLRLIEFGTIGDSEVRGVKDVGGVRDTYAFDLTATGMDDGTSTAEFVLPSDRTVDQPGRWRPLGLLRRVQKFKLTDQVPATAANERALWVRSSDGKLVQRGPSNGTVAPLGTVSSIALTVPNFLQVDPATITDTGTFAITTATELPASQFLATPSAAVGSPALRSLVANDIPVLPATQITDFAEAVDDRVAALLVQGSNITLTYNDTDNTLTIAAAVSSALIENPQTGTSYTLVLADNGKLVSMTNASANTLTVPPDSTVLFPVGTQILLEWYGVGQPTVVPGIGVTVLSPGGKLKIAQRYSIATLIKRAANTWSLVGDIAT